MRIIRIILFAAIFPMLLIANALCGEITRVVSGKVLNEKNFPLYNIKVLINGVETNTDALGKFKMLNVKYPYDAVIAERSSATAVIYKGLSIENPDLILFGPLKPRNIQSATINLRFPEIPAGSSAVIKYISPDVFYCEDVSVFPGEKSKTIIVEWPASKKTLNGSVIFLQKTCTSYQQYMEKSQSLFKKTAPFEMSFDNALVASNTKTSNMVVYLPFVDYNTNGYTISADFFSYNRNSEILLAKEEGSITSGKSIIPSKLPISYRLKVSGFVDYKDGSGFVNYTYVKPGASINLTMESPPELYAPADKFPGATGATEFSYSSGSGTGIYVVKYHSVNPEMNFYVVTNELRTNLYYLSRSEFRKAESVEFKWSIKKYITYFSVDDFVKPNQFQNDIGYKAVLYSAERTFKTGIY